MEEPVRGRVRARDAVNPPDRYLYVRISLQYGMTIAELHIVVGARQVGKTRWLWKHLSADGTPPLALDCAEPLVQARTRSPDRSAQI